MSPILVRPVREQLEHDRVIRLLQVKLKRKHEVIANIGEDQSTSVKIGQVQIFPGSCAHDGGSRPQADGNGRGRNRRVGQPPRGEGPVGAPRAGAGPFHLYVPAGFGRHRPAAGDREPRQRRRDLEFSHDRRPDPLHAGAPHARRYPAVERAARHRDVDKPEPRHRRSRVSCRRRPAKRRSTAVAKPARAAKPSRCRASHAESGGCGESAKKASPARPQPVQRRRRRRPSVRSRRGDAQARRRARPPARAARKGSSPAVSAVQSRQARLREHLRRRYATAAAGVRGRAFSTGSARRRASRSAAPRSTKTRSASSSS